MSRWLAALAAAVSLLSSGPPAFPDTIAEVKATAQNWMQVTVEGIITYTEPSECYIESPDRSGGIWVQAPMDGFEVGDPVIAFGTFAVTDGEPAVTEASVFFHGMPSRIRPLGMRNRAIGGASKWSPMTIWDFGQRRTPSGGGWTWQREWTPAIGANNTGLLVTTWGTVRSIYSSPITGASWMYVDDGSGAVSDYGDTGVLIYADAEADIGDFVSVTGVSSTERSLDDPSRLVRVVRTRTTEDLRVEQASVLPESPTGPFTDEFDRQFLDWWWMAYFGPEYHSSISYWQWSCLKVSVYAGRETDAYPVIVQCTPGDWDLLAKVSGSSRQVLTGQTGVRLYCERDPLSPSYSESQQWIGELYYVAAAPSGWRVRFGDLDTWTAWGDTCVFRVRKRQDTIYVSASPDGASFGEEVILPNHPCPYLAAVMYYTDSAGTLPTSPSEVYLDYFRFSGPSDQGVMK